MAWGNEGSRGKGNFYPWGAAPPGYDDRFATVEPMAKKLEEVQRKLATDHLTQILPI